MLCVRICGAALCIGAARRRAREGNGGNLRFLPWIGGVSWPPTGPQPAPYPQKVESRLTVGQLATRIASPFSYGFEPCPLTRYTAADFTAISPEVVRARLPVMSCVVPVSRGASFPAFSCAGRSLSIIRARLGFSVIRCRRLAAKPAPARAVTSGGIALKYKKNGDIANIRPFKCCFSWNNCLYFEHKGTAAARSRVPEVPFNWLNGSPVNVFYASKTSRQTLGRSPFWRPLRVLYVLY